MLISLVADASIGVGVQFDYAKYGYLFYGVPSENGRPLPARVKPLLQALIGSKTETLRWPAWKRVGPNDRHFPVSQQVDRDFWLAAQDGRLADMLVRFSAEVERALKTSDLLEVVRGRTMVRE